MVRRRFFQLGFHRSTASAAVITETISSDEASPRRALRQREHAGSSWGVCASSPVACRWGRLRSHGRQRTPADQRTDTAWPARVVCPGVDSIAPRRSIVAASLRVTASVGQDCSDHQNLYPASMLICAPESLPLNCHTSTPAPITQRP